MDRGFESKNRERESKLPFYVLIDRDIKLFFLSLRSGGSH
jgi:hypothetical protein